MGMVGIRDVLFVAPASSFHHHHIHHHQDGLLSSADQSVMPLLTAGSCHADDHSRNPGIHLWQQQQNPPPTHQQAVPNPNPNLRKPMPMSMSMLDSTVSLPSNTGGIFNVGGGGVLGGGGGIVLPSSSSTTTCQDCGNQAKKDCSHRRCRTCCKSRGFDCSTHVKSTWVPAARRRESQQISAAAGGGAAVGSSASTSGSKKPRLMTSPSNTSTSNNTSSSSRQEESLPGQVRAPAVFKCVKVTSVEDGEGEYAYQAMVRIGGHVFKGFLYDQGNKERDGDNNNAAGHDDDNNHNIHLGNSNSSSIPNLSELHLGGRNAPVSSPSPMLGVGGGGASDVYGGGGGMMGGGTAYGNHMS